MNRPARAVLEGLIDYAGLFPPAGLAMPEAVRLYASYQRRADAWALGRFVVPAGRLGEFEKELEALPETEGLGARWPLTVLLGGDHQADLDRVEALHSRYVHAGPRVLSLEARVASPGEIARIRHVVSDRYELYLELPLGDSVPDLMQAVGGADARAKVRTGGIRAGEFPAPAAVLGFLCAAARARIAFKATAGLHHPVRGPAPLTYLPGSDCATMFGYLNVVLAATLLWHQRPEGAGRILSATDRGTLQFAEQEIRWDGVAVGVEEIVRARREFAIAIGSCSFTEPLEEIEVL